MRSSYSSTTTNSPTASFITSSWLKWLAIASMLIDHLGAVLLEPWLMTGGGLAAHSDIDWILVDSILRLIGRLAFPLYSFLIVEGYHHTRDVRRYATRLALFALISEIPFNLAISQNWSDLSHQNVFFTLLAGLLAIWAMDQLKTWPLRLLLVGGLILGAEWLMTDYGAYGVLLIVILHWTRSDRRQQALVGALYNLRQLTASLAVLPIYFYNGQKGRSSGKWIYLIYPVHLMVYALIYRIWLR